MSPVNWKGYNTEDDPARAGRFAAWKREKKYWITRCAPGMDQSRADLIHQAFEKSVIPGGNLPEPAFLRDGAAWFCAEEDCPSLLDGYGAKAFMGLRPAHRLRSLQRLLQISSRSTCPRHSEHPYQQKTFWYS